MKKKVIDIISPSNKSLKTEVFGHRVSLTTSPKKKNFNFILLILILLFGAFSYAYFTLPKARIEIWPKTEKLSFETELKIDEKIGKILETEEIISQEFLATEKFLKENKAEGTIRIYNDYSAEPQTLVPRTRFISADGQLFRTPERVIIPGRQQEGGRWIPGTVDVRVIADQPGEKFNIKPTAFVIPGFLGLARYHKIYGRSYQPMTGGIIEEVVRVGEEDLKKAENILQGKTTDACFAALKNKIPQDFNFLKEAVKVEVLEKIQDVKAGTEVEKFNFGIKVNCKVLAFKTKDIEDFVNNFIEKQIPENKIVVPKSLIIDKFFKEQALDLKISFGIYSAVDKDYLRRRLIGKSLIEVQDFFKNLPQINRAYVNFWPFWVESVPKNLDRIKIGLRFLDE